jgi:hypothetical protein
MTFNDFIWQVRHLFPLISHSQIRPQKHPLAPTSIANRNKVQVIVSRPLRGLFHDDGVYPPLHVRRRHQGH